MLYSKTWEMYIISTEKKAAQQKAKNPVTRWVAWRVCFLVHSIYRQFELMADRSCAQEKEREMVKSSVLYKKFVVKNTHTKQARWTICKMEEENGTNFPLNDNCLLMVKWMVEEVCACSQSKNVTNLSISAADTNYFMTVCVCRLSDDVINF